MALKNFIKSILNFLHFDVTKNLKYDRLTKEIMKEVIAEDANCIDIGCHKGEILECIIEFSPKGNHFAFEPIPELYKQLKLKFRKVNTYPFALANETKKATFNYVKNAPAYSGIKQRKYAVENPDIEEIEVDLKKLDDIIPSETAIDFIKIDVEGAELGVLQGSKNLLIKNKPFVIFEFGLGASDYYDTKPSDIYNLLVTEVGIIISTLDGWIAKKSPMSAKAFEDCFNSNCEYYFIAHP